MATARIGIRKPTALFRSRDASQTFNLDRPIKGLRVGMRTDQLWRSWLEICGVWSEMLRKDGAEPELICIGEHVGQHTEGLVRAWANSVDCAVVGLAN